MTTPKTSALTDTTLLDWGEPDPKGRGRELGKKTRDLNHRCRYSISDFKGWGDGEESGYFQYYLHECRSQPGWFCPGQAVKEDGVPYRNTGVA